MKLLEELKLEIKYICLNSNADIVTDLLAELFKLSGEPGIKLQDIREQLALLIDEINNQ